jgi:transposase
MVLAGEDLGEPKTADGATEMLRVLRIARNSAVRARAKAFAALKDLIVTAPAELRERLAGRHKRHLIGACAGLTTSEIACTPAEAVTIAVKSLAERCLRLDAETKTLDQQIEALTPGLPRSTTVYGVGPDTAATVLVAESAPAPPHPARRPRGQPRTHRFRRCVGQTLRWRAGGSLQWQNRAAPA